STTTTSRKRFVEALVKMKSKSHSVVSAPFLATIIVRPGEITIVPFEQRFSSMVVKIDEMVERPRRPLGADYSWIVQYF
ncbi:hypothetical protein PMAYCL1PPCAC_08226, partial [Pristionchus mayeri]